MPQADSEITIRLPELVDAATLARLGKGAAQLALIAAARLARARWLALAHDRLRGHGQDLAAYVASIGLPELDGDQVTLRLVGDAAGRIEAGRPRVDLRQVLLGDQVPVLVRGQTGRGKRQSRAGGYYRAIPMPPRGGSTEAAAAPPQAAGDAALAQELAAAARRLISPAGLGAGAGLALTPAGGAGLTSDPMARLYRSAGQAPAARVGPVQFRTISTLKTTGWMLRPVPGAHIMRDLEKTLAKDVPAAIGKMLAEVHLPGTSRGMGE